MQGARFIVDAGDIADEAAAALRAAKTPMAGDLAPKLDALVARAKALEEAMKNAAVAESGKGSNEARAIGALRTINTAQSLFREGDKDMNGTLDYASTLQMLQTSGNLIDRTLAKGTKSGYTFRVLPPNPADRDMNFTWSVVAEPVRPGETGDRYFYIDESGVIRFEAGKTATSCSTPIGG
jgi:hypothetical protein